MKPATKYIVTGCLTAWLLGGCSSNAEHAATAIPATGAAISTSGANAAASQASAAPASQEPVNKLHYSKKQLQEIREAAQQAGLEQVYIPTVGGGPDDYFEEAKVQGRKLTLHFIQMAVTESGEELEPVNPDRTVRTVLLADGQEGKWINEEESTVAYLYASKGTTNIQVFSASPFDGKDFEAAAESMILLQ